MCAVVLDPQSSSSARSALTTAVCATSTKQAAPLVLHVNQGHCADVDEYNRADSVSVEVWVLASGQDCSTATGKHNTAVISSDNSVTLQDNFDGEGVDFFNAGTNNKLQTKSFTIYSGTDQCLSPCVSHVSCASNSVGRVVCSCAQTCSN